MWRFLTLFMRRAVKAVLTPVFVLLASHFYVLLLVLFTLQAASAVIICTGSSRSSFFINLGFAF